MILKLDNKILAVAKEIHSVFQASYLVEAKLLKAVDFPPLKRTVSQFLNSTTDFYAYYLYAYYLNNNIAGVIEIDNSNGCTHIQSLVVYPKCFRKGVGKKLVSFVLKTYPSNFFSVETGVDNTPATMLYLGLGFQEKTQWDTTHGIRKIRFEKKL